jgi:L,D-peptidoglycan transpeptidase YkuD (ErfK/YbiS/YcfS/YnhG family)
VGKGSLAIHRVANWTGGCVAVENGQIQRLTGIVRIGTVVEIR